MASMGLTFLNKATRKIIEISDILKVGVGGGGGGGGGGGFAIAECSRNEKFVGNGAGAFSVHQISHLEVCSSS